MNDGALVIAYHGCDVTVRDRLIRGTLRQLTPSANRYDWLGNGVYFFEGDAERALSFATSARDSPSKLLSSRPVVNPAVVGCVFCVSRWWDMTTLEGRRNYVNALAGLEKAQEVLGRPMPINEPAGGSGEFSLLRRLDCAVFNFGHLSRRQQGLTSYQAVRAAFYQGQPVAHTSEFRAGTHLQIALRDPRCVLGWFLPEDVGPALLSDSELSVADAELVEAIRLRSALKPRVRVRP